MFVRPGALSELIATTLHRDGDKGVRILHLEWTVSQFIRMELLRNMSAIDKLMELSRPYTKKSPFVWNDMDDSLFGVQDGFCTEGQNIRQLFIRTRGEDPSDTGLGMNVFGWEMEGQLLIYNYKSVKRCRELIKNGGGTYKDSRDGGYVASIKQIECSDSAAIHFWGDFSYAMMTVDFALTALTEKPPEPDGQHYYPVKPDIFLATYEAVDD